jgi:VWFA-related protein
MSHAVRVPVVHGFRRPAIVLPTSAAQWPQDRCRAFLLHELAHVRRQDWPMQMLGHLARALYWPHPLAWWLVRRLRAEAERASDDCVLLAGIAAPDYADHLLQAARDLGRAPQQEAVLAVVERSRFEDRLLALLDPQVCRRALDRRLFGFAAVTALTVIAGVAGLQPVARALADTPEIPVTRDRVTRSEPALRETPGGRDQGTPVPAAASAPRTAEAPPPAGRPVDPDHSESARGLELSGPEAPALADPSAATASNVEEDEPEPLEVEVVREGTALPSPEPSAAPAARPRPVIRISTDLVQIDAVITNKNGQSVVDLAPEDFEVFEDGRKQTVSHVYYVAAGPGKTGSSVRTPTAAAESMEPRNLVFVVDDLGLSLESAVRTRKLLQRFVSTGLKPRDRAAIIETSALREGTYALTSDPAILAAAAAGIRYRVEGRASLDLDRFDWLNRANRFNRSRYDLDATSRHSQLVMESLRSLKRTIDALRALPGRKAVILVSEGFTTRVSHDVDRLLQRFAATSLDTLYGDSSLYSAMRALTDLANRASVVIYTLDPMGLQVEVSSGPMGTGGDSRTDDGQFTGIMPGGASQEWQQRAAIRRAREESLIEIADQTGGIAVISNNDLNGGLDRIITDLSGYYLIGYVPDAATFGSSPGQPRFHHVKVEVKRRGLKVRSRKGFYGVTDEVVAQTSPPK